MLELIHCLQQSFYFLHAWGCLLLAVNYEQKQKIKKLELEVDN
jgi:hypothetical protein